MILPAQLHDAVMIFLGVVIEALPFLLMGVLVSAFLRVYIKDQWLLRVFPKNSFGQMVVGSLLGFLFPVCECGNIPVARRLIAKGVSVHAAVTFLLTAPVLNPLVIAATYVAFRGNPMMVVWRMVFTILIAYTIGFLVLLATKGREEEFIETQYLPRHQHAHHGAKLPRFVHSAKEEFMEMGGILVFGGILASLSQTLIPRSVITSIGRGPLLSVVAMMLLAAVISICSNVDAFFALGYSTQFTDGALLAFLVFGPMIDIKALVMMRSVFRWHMIIWIMILVAALSFVSMLGFNYFVG